MYISYWNIHALAIEMYINKEIVSTNLSKHICNVTIKVKIYWTNGKICRKVAFPRYTESVKFRSQSRQTASKRKPYRGLRTR